MSRIKVLSQYTANQIAAGEVVERPASIVKELVENAIDAGASTITIETKGGGLESIRVVDNGSGIAAEDAETAFLRHATSKISTAEDLSHIEMCIRDRGKRALMTLYGTYCTLHR